jgi:hypothetical protein
MDNLHNETLMISQVQIVVNLNVEFVNIVDDLVDPNFCGSTFAWTFVGCVGSPSIIVDGNLSTTVTTNKALWSTLAKQKDF